MATVFKIKPDYSGPLYDIAGTRALEQQAQERLPAHALMQRAGLAAAQLALALVPHSQNIWVACGPGNNGGDGFEAALELHRRGKRVTLAWTGQEQLATSLTRPPPKDALAARQRALAAGLRIEAEPPAHFDLALDALLGIGGILGADRPGQGLMTQWLQRMHSSGSIVLALDLPTGLNPDTGARSYVTAITANVCVNPGLRHTLSLLTLKPGLFTASGRDEAGQVWLADLDIGQTAGVQPCAWLQGAKGVPGWSDGARPHASHKGSFGDVAVLGGDSGGASRPQGSSMTGAALLAARAALHAGAGRVFVALLGEQPLRFDPAQPELMFRSPEALDLKRGVLVCGCGGGDAVSRYLSAVLSAAPRAVLDADALNAISGDTQLQTQVMHRQGRGYATILTPHPLEAARLLQCSAHEVQQDRRAAAQEMAEKFLCVVVLKGSGTVIAAPGQTPRINHSGNGLLAAAGTGDVLAGVLGAALANGHSAWNAAIRSVFLHGRAADNWASTHKNEALTASILATLIRA